MKYRKLGNTGLIVSEVALGTMQFGGKMNMGNLGQEDTTRMVKLALDRGINFIDTADVYSLGESGTLVGNTGLIVSSVALGTMQFGGKMNMGNLGQEDTTRMVKLALDRGINFIDTADVY